MRLTNKDLTVRQWVVATINGVVVDWEGKCNCVKVEDGLVIFSDVHRNDPSKFLLLDAFPQELVTRISWKYGDGEIKKYFLGEENDDKTTTVEVAEPEDAIAAEKKDAKRENRSRK